MAEYVTVETPMCVWCGRRGTVVVTRAGFKRWQNGLLIQVALPLSTPEEREQLRTGTHPECWEHLVGPEHD